MATAIFNPDEHPETTSVDGCVVNFQTAGVAWSTLRDAASGTSVTDGNASALIVYIMAGYVTANTYRQLNRSILLFDISLLPLSAKIVSAQLKIYGIGKSFKGDFAPNFGLVVVSSNPDSNTVLIVEDYSELGTTAFSDVISYANFDDAGWNTFTLNATAIDFINTALAGDKIVKFGIRDDAYDRAGVEPTWVSDGRKEIDFYAAGSTDYPENAPILSIEYTAMTWIDII